jgi:hypothetical protein
MAAPGRGRERRVALLAAQPGDPPAGLARSDDVGRPVVADVEDRPGRRAQRIRREGEDRRVRLDRADPLRDEDPATYRSMVAASGQFERMARRNPRPASPARSSPAPSTGGIVSTKTRL